MYLVVMPVSDFIVIFSTILDVFFNCPSVICLPSMLIFYGETPLVNYGPRSFSLHQYINRNQALFTFCNLLFIYFTANISFHSIQLILCFQQTGEIDNLTESWGKVFWLCCAGSMLLLMPVARLPTTSQPETLSKRLPSATGR